MTDSEISKFLRLIAVLKTNFPEFYNCLRYCIDEFENKLILQKLVNKNPKSIIIPPCDFYN
jgi:hypothetical protein